MTKSPQLREPLRCMRGETLERTLRFSDRTTGLPIDITDWVMTMDFRISKDSGVAGSATIAARDQTLDKGAADLVIGSDTTDIEARTYKFDIRISYDSKVKYYIRGELIIEDAMTRA